MEDAAAVGRKAGAGKGDFQMYPTAGKGNFAQAMSFERNIWNGGSGLDRLSACYGRHFAWEMRRAYPDQRRFFKSCGKRYRTSDEGKDTAGIFGIHGVGIRVIQTGAPDSEITVERKKTTCVKNLMLH